MKNRKLQLCLASLPAAAAPAAGAPDLSQAVKTIRESGAELEKCIAGMVDILEDPLKSKFLEIKDQVNRMLANMPPTDQVPAASASNNILERLLWVLQSAQSMMSGLADTAKNARQEIASTKASMTAEVEKALNSKVAAGEFIPKADVDKRVADAVAAAATAAENKIKSELKLVGDRRALLASAKLPVPGEDVLVLEEQAFVTRKDLAAKRAEELKPFGLPEDRVLALCWAPDQAGYDSTISLLKEVAGKFSKNSLGANPFNNRTGSDAAPANNGPKAVVGVC